MRYRPTPGRQLGILKPHNGLGIPFTLALHCIQFGLIEFEHMISQFFLQRIFTVNDIFSLRIADLADLVFGQFQTAELTDRLLDLIEIRRPVVPDLSRGIVLCFPVF